MATRPGSAPRLTMGIEYDYIENVKDALNSSIELNFSYFCSKLVSADVISLSIEAGESIPCDKFWKDCALTASEWRLGVVGVVPNPPELESEDVLVRKHASKAMNRQLDYAHHLSLSGVIFELTGPSNNLAQIVCARMEKITQYFTFLAKVKYGGEPGGDVNGETDEGWRRFNTFRKLCGSHRRLLAVLQIGYVVPADSSKLDRWKGELVSALSIPMSSFRKNSRGFPVLLRSHQAVVKKFMALGAHIILEADIPFDEDTFPQYVEYLTHLHQTQIALFKNSLQENRNYAPGYGNYLHHPMQPLADHLSFETYALFEKDPVKYELYRDAIGLAFRKKLPPAATQEQRAATDFVVVVAGAGRGKLVTMTFEAAAAERVNVKVYALEKNPSAETCLNLLNRSKWAGKAVMVSADMRYWNAPEKADIIVSELLGSFGDNELSPECLDGAQRFLKDDGIIIPEEYTSFIAPIMSQALHVEANQMFTTREDAHKNFETTYVSMITRKYDIAKPIELFKFHHPAVQTGAGPVHNWNRSNDRYKTLEFDVEQDCDCHGFVGYFDSTLFSDEVSQVTMSILPETYSGKMHSWHPLFIPLKAGVALRKGDKLVVSFWRKSTSTKVWYEWSVTAPVALPIHNVNGRSSFMGVDSGE